MGLARSLYRAARLANDAEVLASGDPRRVRRRAKNIVLGRALGRAGVWRRSGAEGSSEATPKVTA
jgi:hypothetical protein